MVGSISEPAGECRGEVGEGLIKAEIVIVGGPSTTGLELAGAAATGAGF